MNDSTGPVSGNLLHVGLLRFAGPDAASFLQGQVLNDTRRLSAGAPLLAGVVAWAECELEQIHDSGDHELVTGRVVSLGVGEGLPLVFYRGGFGTYSV